MKSNFTRNQIVEILSEKPFINYACKKAGIARATVYRWIKDIPEFRQAIDEALKHGRANAGEIAESKLLKLVNEGDFRAIQYYLNNNDPRYMPKRTAYIIPKEHKHNFEPGDVCSECGYRSPAPHNFDEAKQFHKAFSQDEYTEEMHQKYLKEFFSKTPKQRKIWEKIKKRKP